LPRLHPFAVLPLAMAAPAGAQTIVLPDIVVSANRTPTAAEATGSAVSVLTGETLEADGRPFLQDQLADLPGITVNQSGPPGTISGFALRGAPQQYVRVLVDGIEVSDPAGTQVSPSLSNLLVDDISRVEVLKGSQSALYGGQAVAGVIDLTSPRAERDGLESRYLLEGGSYSSARGRYTLAGRNDRGEFALTAARFQTDGFSAAEEADGNDEDDGYDVTRLSATGTFYATERLSLFGATFHQTEDGEFDGSDPVTFAPADADNSYDIDSWGARAGFDLSALDGRLENRLALSYYRIDRGSDDDFGRSTFDGNRTRVEYIGQYRQSEALSWQFGADWTREESESTSPFGPPTGTEEQSVAGVFGQALWSPTEPLTLTLALRQDEHSEFGGYTTGRVSAAYALSSDTILRASAGTGFRAPSNFELFDPTYGNPDLGPETSVSADVGVEQRFLGNRARVGVTAFLLDIEDLIEFDSPTSRYVQTNGVARSRGLEVAAGYDLTDALTVSGSYTYTDARTPAGDQRLKVPRHSLAVRLDGSFGERLSVGLDALYAADLPDEPFTESAAFHSSYTVVNARVAYAISEAAEVYVRAENLFDAEYQTVEGYSTPGRSAYFGVSGRF
jgi:vitamin B12 transporter